MPKTSLKSYDFLLNQDYVSCIELCIYIINEDIYYLIIGKTYYNLNWNVISYK